MQSGLSYIISIMLEEGENKSSLAADLQPPLTPIPNKIVLLPPPPVPTPVPTIAAATVVMVYYALPDLSTKF